MHYVHLEARVPHVTGSLTCVPREGSKTVNKKESLRECKISFSNGNPQDFLQKINCCFAFCNLKAAISTFLRYSRRPKHFWKENKYMKRDWLFYFQCAEYIRLLFIL